MRRILVAIDASPGSLAACEAAAELAAAMRAELSGLFVEDVELLRSAAIPFTRELGGRTARSREFDVRLLEAQLRAEAQRAREALADIAAHARVEWTFRVTRGAVARELAREAELADLVTLGSVGHGERIGRTLGSTVRALREAGRGQFLVLRRGMHVNGPVRVLIRRVEDVPRLVEAAIVVTRTAHPPLSVVACAPTEHENRAIATEVADYLEGRPVQLTVSLVSAETPAQVVDRVELAQPGILVVDAAGALLDDNGTLSSLVRRSGAPVMLVS